MTEVDCGPSKSNLFQLHAQGSVCGSDDKGGYDHNYDKQHLSSACCMWMRHTKCIVLIFKEKKLKTVEVKEFAQNSSPQTRSTHTSTPFIAYKPSQ